MQWVFKTIPNHHPGHSQLIKFGFEITSFSLWQHPQYLFIAMEYHKKPFQHLKTFFYVYLIKELREYAWNISFTMAFIFELRTCKMERPIQLFVLFWSALRKSSWELNLLYSRNQDLQSWFQNWRCLFRYLRWSI